MEQVPISPRSPDRFRQLLPADDWATVERGIAEAHRVFAGRAMWHVNSTAHGGGVAEMLTSLLAYVRGVGVDARWIVIEGDPDFFRVTKRIHNNLHGAAGDGGDLGDDERAAYERALAPNAAELTRLVRPNDIVFLHDPQTAGLIEAAKTAAPRVVWRCHVGLDLPNDLARRAWDFLRPYVIEADAWIFSREAFAWEGLMPDRTWIVPPSIDAFAPKNQEMSAATVSAILATIGLGAGSSDRPPTFERVDGTPGRVDRSATIFQDGPVPEDAPVVAQVSRWDSLKDPVGVLRCFADHCNVPGAHLVLAGPAVDAVSDDPEGAAVLAEVREHWQALPAETRARVHLVTLPMEDGGENAAMVNAIQRRADVVVQKSLAEGFGLTVAEAMWKAKPVVAGRIGGIQDQIESGESGILVDDPADLAAVGAAVETLLADRRLAERIGSAARERVRAEFLGTRHLIQYLNLLATLIGLPEERAAA